jgi:hypothetical protein
MQNPEQQLAFLKGVENCDLCVTDKRLVIVSPKAYLLGKIVGFAIGGGLGANIGSEIQQRVDAKHRQEEPQPMGITIDELLKKDPRSYAVPYEEMDWMCLNKSMWGGNLTYMTKKAWTQLKMNKEQFKALSLVLPDVAALKEKFKINQ